SEAEERGRQEMSKALDDIISEAEERGRQEACKELDGIISEAEERGRQEACKELDNRISEAEERGKEIGTQEGAQLKAMEIAQQLLGILDVATIAEKTGLSLKSIENLRISQE
ncbi:MAG: hypothetical protein IJ040_08415, partial [Lachnospiraceae bacterium]|nr:hypothetical protein [Lachnospiraceae bacterium]